MGVSIASTSEFCIATTLVLSTVMNKEVWR